MPRRRTLFTALTAAVLAGVAPAGTAAAAPGDAAVPPPEKVPRAVGTGGAVATVDPDATRVGLEVLAAGGNAERSHWDASQLPPVDYTLRILAADYHGNEAKAGHELPITVE